MDKNLDEKKVNQLQLIEQSLHQLTAQKQQFQLQKVEIDAALKELEKTEQAYKLVGNIMVASKKDDLSADLTKKKELVDLRISTYEKQENDLREKAKKLQSDVLQGMKKE